METGRDHSGNRLICPLVLREGYGFGTVPALLDSPFPALVRCLAFEEILPENRLPAHDRPLAQSEVFPGRKGSVFGEEREASRE